MEHINKIELKGRIGTVRTNEYNGSKVTNFTMVTELLYKTRDNVALSETTWHNVVAWHGKDMPAQEQITKGIPVHVTGRLRANRYTSADGTEKLFYEVLASKMRIIEDEQDTM